MREELLLGIADAVPGCPRQNRYWYSYPFSFSTFAIRWLASTQSCIPSRITFGLSESLSPTERKMRIGFFGSFGISVSWKPQAPSGYFGSNGHAWFTNVPDVVSTRWYRSLRNQAMMSAQDPPELLPIAARPSGSFVSFTLQFFSTRGSTSSSMYVA